MPIKWYKADAGEYRAEPTPEGSEFYVRKGQYGWEYGRRPSGEYVPKGWAPTARAAKEKAPRPVLREVVDDLQALDFEGMGYEAGAAAVLLILREHGVDYKAFRELDEGPGNWMIKQPDGGYSYSSWHYKLRQVRNDPEQPLFEVLKANER